MRMYVLFWLLTQIISVFQDTIKLELAKAFPLIPVEFQRQPTSLCPTCGMGIVLYAQTSEGHRIAASTMIEIPVRTSGKHEVKARERAAIMVKWLTKQIALGGVVDEYLADQIVIFMALATIREEQRSELLVGEVSLHTETAMRTAETMLREIVFSVRPIKEGGYLMICERKALN